MSITLLSIFAALVPLAPADSALWTVADQSYDNPAVRQWMLSGSYTEGHAGYVSDRRNAGIDPRQGNGSHQWQLEAGTYLKHGTSTLWGNALYANGKERNIRWNETSDVSLLYPYLTADSLGGNLKLERYAFSGGYADHRGRWAWGGQLGYSAGLYYRSIDPRPRNVTGMLSISAGAGYQAFGDYYTAVSLGYQKYKQSNSIDFKNEMGSEKIYHLTGMGMHYHRFAGVGKSANYNGHSWSAGFNLYPCSGRGFAFTVDYQYFSFRKILTDLNKLPLATASTGRIGAQASWLQPGRESSWGANVTFMSSRKRGKENIFGDASSNIYPQIGSLQMYCADTLAVSISGIWQYQRGGTVLWLKPEANLYETNETYAKPARQLLLDRLRYGLTAHLSFPLGTGWRFSAEASGQWNSPMRSHSTLSKAQVEDDGALAVLGAIEEHRYNVLRRSHGGYNVNLRMEHALSKRIRIYFSGDYTRTLYRLDCGGNLYHGVIGVCF